LAVAVGDEYPEIDPLEFDENDELLANEEAAIGTNHCCFGTWFAKEAGLPDNLIEVIRFHHSSGPFAPHGKLVSLVIAADDMANHLQRKGLASEYSPTSNPGICQLVQHCGDAVLTQFEDEAESLLSDVQDLTV
jgi:HD-like signal output (HDOD) protein